MKVDPAEALSNSHMEGDHDIDPVDGCPLCELAAVESARLIRESTRRKKKSSTGQSPEDAKIVEDWKNGVTIAQIRSRTGKKRSQIRKILEDGVGGKQKFKEFRTQGAGGSRSSGRRGRGRSIEQEQLPPDHFIVPDFGVPRITSAKLSDGWKYHLIKTGYDSDGHPEWKGVHTSPEGIQYVFASPNEHADLVYDCGKDRWIMEPIRMKKLDYASASYKAEAHAEHAEALREAAARKRAAKRERRVARKMKRVA